MWDKWNVQHPRMYANSIAYKEPFKEPYKESYNVALTKSDKGPYKRPYEEPNEAPCLPTLLLQEDFEDFRLSAHVGRLPFKLANRC